MTGGWLFLKKKKFEQPIAARLNRSTSDTRLTKDTSSRTNRDGPLVLAERSSNDRILPLAITGVAPFPGDDTVALRSDQDRAAILDSAHCGAAIG